MRRLTAPLTRKDLLPRLVVMMWAELIRVTSAHTVALPGRVRVWDQAPFTVLYQTSVQLPLSEATMLAVPIRVT